METQNTKKALLGLGLLLAAVLVVTNVRRLFEEQTEFVQGSTPRTKKTGLFVAENILGCGGEEPVPSAPRTAPCGMKKCFFFLKDSPEVGYLVAPYQKTGDKDILGFENAVRIHNLTLRLEHKYGINHFLLEPPQYVRVPGKELVDCIQSQAYPANLPEMAFLKDIPKGERWHMAKFVARGAQNVPQHLTIWKNRVAPQPNLVFGCRKGKTDALAGSLPIFLERLRLKQQNNSNTNSDSSSDDHMFRALAQTVEQESKVALNLLQQEADWLLADFQFLVGPDGRFHYIDLGRDGSNGPGMFDSQLKKKERLFRECKDAISLLNKVIQHSIRNVSNT